MENETRLYVDLEILGFCCIDFMKMCVFLVD